MCRHMRREQPRDQGWLIRLLSECERNDDGRPRVGKVATKVQVLIVILAATVNVGIQVWLTWLEDMDEWNKVLLSKMLHPWWCLTDFVTDKEQHPLVHGLCWTTDHIKSSHSAGMAWSMSMMNSSHPKNWSRVCPKNSRRASWLNNGDYNQGDGGANAEHQMWNNNDSQ
jgi:hypothetical protein